jgi:putative intracellular protease/amidase
MKRILVTSLFATLLSLSFAQPVRCQDDTKVLLFIRGGSPDWAFMLEQEVGVMKRVLEDNGFEVAVATVSGDTISVGSITLVPDLRLRDVNIDDYAGYILPCMAASNYVAPGAVEMVSEAAAAGKLVAAQLNSILTLVEAGLLKGKRYAFGAEIDASQYPLVEGATYAGNGVVRDGNILTSGICPYMARRRGVPDRTEELAQALADAILHND